ncbi:MAG TPA: c-type cytochrome [Pseudomonadales bacterium]
MKKSLVAGLYLALTSVVPAVFAESPAGQQEFTEYCASCHGIDGRGHGPQSLETGKPPRDLTLLSQANGGSFPYSRVRSVIDGRVERGKNSTAHLRGGMPVWGDVFVSEKGSSAASQIHGEAVAKMRILNIVDYLVSIQREDDSI